VLIKSHYTANTSDDDTDGEREQVRTSAPAAYNFRVDLPAMHATTVTTCALRASDSAWRCATQHDCATGNWEAISPAISHRYRAHHSVWSIQSVALRRKKYCWLAQMNALLCQPTVKRRCRKRDNTRTHAHKRTTTGTKTHKDRQQRAFLRLAQLNQPPTREVPAMSYDTHE
jgi:hypothetical protein